MRGVGRNARKGAPSIVTVSYLSDVLVAANSGSRSLLSEGVIACHGAAKGDAVGCKGWGAIAQIRGAERRGAAMVALRGG